MVQAVTTRIRPARIVGDVAYVPLTRGKEALIDAADVERVSSKVWCFHHRGYAISREKDAGGKTRELQMHRFIAQSFKGVEVDHVNGNKLDNRRSNLRHATRSQNEQNKGLIASNTSGYKGVTFHKQTGKWQAVIGANNKSHYLGLHQTAELAHAAYCAEAKRLHGDFMRTS